MLVINNNILLFASFIDFLIMFILANRIVAYRKKLLPDLTTWRGMILHDISLFCIQDVHFYR